jgi:hypothetical protein
MIQNNLKERSILRNLGGGLILRRAVPEDTEELVDFNARIHSDAGPEHPDERVGAWVRDLMVGPHPTFKTEDFTVVEDTATGKIVSSLNLISQTWSYGGIPFGVGRPELVATLPEYRNRGLVRAQFEVIHQWSADRGEKMQAITGIPYYYRLFGYEMGLALEGFRAGFIPQVPKLKEGETEPYRLRPAAEADLPFIASLYEQACQRYLVNCIWDEALWGYELKGKSEKNINRMELRLIETPAGEPVGFLAHQPFTWGPSMATLAYEVKPSISWAAVTPSVIRYLQAAGEALPPFIGTKEPFSSFIFRLGAEHPVYQVIPDRLPRMRRPYAWYVRVPDLVDFLRHIAPVLEKRLAGSLLVGYTGEFKITFYRSGLHLVFEQGRLKTVEGWKPTPQGHSGDSAFPDLTFLQLLFGYRSLEELRYAFADCGTRSDEVATLLNILFPKQASDVWPIS